VQGAELPGTADCSVSTKALIKAVPLRRPARVAGEQTIRRHQARQFLELVSSTLQQRDPMGLPNLEFGMPNGKFVTSGTRRSY
jgi:hypothetical protein